MPVRSIPRSHRSVTGRQTVVGQRSVAVESTLERDFVLSCQFYPSFVAIEEQPVAIPMPPRRRYIPDFLVTWQDREPELVEVKYQQELADKAEILAPKFAAAKDYAQTQGWTFRVVTERDIRTPWLKNANFLLPFRHRTVDPGMLTRLINCLNHQDEMSAADLIAQARPAGDAGPALPALWQLVATFKVQTDLDQPLTMSSMLRLDGECHGKD